MTDWASAAVDITRRYRLDKWLYPSDALPLAGGLRAGPLPLPMRVEMFWRRENFQPIIQMNLTAIRRLHLPLDIAALENALVQLVQRHEPLRSALLLVDGNPAQQILKSSPVALDIADLTALAPDVRAKEEARLMYDFARQPIDLFSGPTFRVRLLRSGAEDFVLGILLHHYFGDAKSLQIILNDLLSLYAAITSGRPALLPVLRWQYADYALWQRNFAAPRLEEYLEYWKKRLADAPWLGLSPQGEADRKGAGMTSFVVPADVAVRVKAAAHGAKTTLFSASLAAYQLAVAAFSGQRDIVTSVPVAARARRDFADTVGYLMNALPVHTHVDPQASIAEILETFSRKLMADYFRQDVSYELLEEFLPGPQPISTNMFNFVPLAFSQPHPDFGADEILKYDHPDFDAAMRSGPRVRVMKDFVFFLHEMPEGLAGIILYNPDYFDATRIDTLATYFFTQLNRIADAA